ncbi:MAG: glycosyl hydrolase family 18 protein, partial [Clostridia bacterium]
TPDPEPEVDPEVTPDPDPEVTPDPDPEETPDAEVPQIDELDFGVGYGIEWETGVFAPFADMGAWVTDATYSNSGALDLGQVMEDTGIKYFNAGFINAVDSTVDANGVLNWGFGGYEVLAEEHTASNAQYNGIKEAIADVRANGGDVVISIGGLNEANFFQATSDVDVLVNTYIEIIDGFNLTRIDLDIEGGAQGYATNEINAQAMKLVQDATGVEVVLTLPVLPTGLTDSLGLPTLQAYVDAGVDVEVVNIMTMCYGTSYGDYADATIEAIDSTMQQIKDSYAKVGITLTDAEAYNKVGITTSIGYEGSAHPIFTVDDSAQVVEYAAEKEINFVSFWSINRDSETQDNSGIYGQYEHTEVYLGFQDGSIVPEIPEVAPEVTPDPEPEVDPEVTPDPEPEVNPEVTPDPEPEVNPEVTPDPDPEPETPEVPEVDVPDGDEWSRATEATGAYITGSVVTYKGVIYEQVSSSTAWWCEPGTNSSVWKAIGTDSSYVVVITEWSRDAEATGAYTPGTFVTYNGITYKQVSSSTAWWCEPGTNSSVWQVQ